MDASTLALRKTPHILITTAPEDEKRAFALHTGLMEQGVKVDLWPIMDSNPEYCSNIELDDCITHLIVLCSPSGANNFCVSNAISSFLKRHTIRNVLPILITSAQFSDNIVESYPQMLRQAWVDGRLVPQEPIPAVASIDVAEKTVTPATIKILLSIKWKPRRKSWTITPIFGQTAIAAGLAILLISTSLTIASLNKTQRSKEAAFRSEVFANTMLSRLESELSSKSRREVFSIIGADVIKSAQREGILNLPGERLTQISKLLHVIGDARATDGDIDGSLQALELASELTNHLMIRSPNDLERVYDHSQSVFWLANHFYTHGDFLKAKPKYQKYSELSEKLISSAPHNLKYKAELAYARNNSGMVCHAQTALEHFEQAINLYNDGLLSSGEVRGDSLANAHGWAADSSIEMGDLTMAESHQIKGTTIWQGLVSVTPKSRSRRMKLSNSLRKEALLFFDTGELIRAERILIEADNILTKLAVEYPNNQKISRRKLAVMRDRARIALWQGNIPLAQLANRMAKSIRVSGEIAKADYGREFDTGKFDLLSARIAYAASEFDSTYTFSVSAMANFEKKVHKGQLYRKHYIAEALYVQGEALYAMGRQGEATRAWVIGLEQFNDPLIIQSLRAKDTQSKLLWRLGKIEDANSIREKLVASGYRRKESIPIWNDLGDTSSSIASLQKEKANE